jgi:hypothetical protein
MLDIVKRKPEYLTPTFRGSMNYSNRRKDIERINESNVVLIQYLITTASPSLT